MTTTTTPITVAYGDGIGPEIMKATLKILEAAGAKLAIETINIGEKVYEQGIPGGIEPSAWQSLRHTKVFLKAPITTPQGGGVKSLNVTVRKTLGLYANVRPCVAYAPYVKTKHPKMDVVIVRENEEGLYGGIEHRQTHDVFQCLKLNSVPGCEHIIRYAFEYARTNNRKKISCFTKDNILKLTDGLFHQVYEAVAKEYPEIEHDHWIIDIGTAKLASEPEMFDVIVLPNLYGDILSDVALELAGSVGMGGSSNIGDSCAMFEAIHGSAPPIAGQGIANPSGLLSGAMMMLVHIGQAEIANTIRNAWLKTIEDGIHTADIYDPSHSQEKASTDAFADAVIARLGQVPSQLPASAFQTDQKPMHLNNLSFSAAARKSKRECVGADVFVYHPEHDIATLATKLQEAAGEGFTLKTMTNRGLKVWPEVFTEALCVDQYCGRFMADGVVAQGEIAKLLQRVAAEGVEFVKVEKLYNFDGLPGYSAGQGE
ncbi:MAG: isocitrate dehydrogenase [NADP] [marine bacterium B5-7]|nr:MAG: isocitrate dehydrogenase [NADP] [marine bacterium B5-7]